MGNILENIRKNNQAEITSHNIQKSFGGNEIEKGFGKDLQNKFPNGKWVTMSGARVFVNNGKVVAGLDGFNKEIDKLYEKKNGGKSKQKDTKSGENKKGSGQSLPDKKVGKKQGEGIPVKTPKEISSFGKRDLDNEKTEHISMLSKLASKIDEKYLSQKTKNKLSKLTEDIYVNAYVEDEKNNKLYEANDIKESLSALANINKKLEKQGEYSIEKDMIDKIQSVLVEAAKEQLNKKNTEKLQYKMF